MPFFNNGKDIQKLQTDDARVQIVRTKVLDALDSAAFELYGKHNIGWTDRELRSLLQEIDRQAANIFERVCKTETEE
jgi:hypothetical protein